MMNAVYSDFARVLTNEVFPRINWGIFKSLYIAGTMAYAPTKHLLPGSDIDLVAVTSQFGLEEKILQFTSQASPPPKGEFVDSLETVFMGTSKRVSLHTFTPEAVEKIAHLENSVLKIWRSPKTKFLYDWIYPSPSGKRIQRKIEAKEFPDGLLCYAPITLIEDGEIYFGKHPQEFLTYAVPVLDQDGFLMKNIIDLHQAIFNQFRDFSDLVRTPFNQYWARHDDFAISLLEMRFLASKLMGRR